MQEVILENRVEQTWSKKRILSIYLNRVYLGPGVYGLGEAAHHYFAKPPEELSAAEAALIAGLVKSPHLLDPLKYPEKAHERKRYVLNTMREAGFLFSEEYDKAMAERLAIVKP
jgi:membrane peptidoglycan carboxypeptidase